MRVSEKITKLEKVLKGFNRNREFSGIYEVAEDCTLMGCYMLSQVTGASRCNYVSLKKGDRVSIRDAYSGSSHWLTFKKV